ncbi:hypothetical protein ILYODFUR_006473, partial [Ilyodon furcidens]
DFSTQNIANSNPLVSDRQDLSVLQKEYAEDDAVYQLKLKVGQHLLPRCPCASHPHTAGSIYVVLSLQPGSKGPLLIVFCCRIYTKNTRTSAKHGQMETAFTEPLALHIWSPC